MARRRAKPPTEFVIGNKDTTFDLMVHTAEPPDYEHVGCMYRHSQGRDGRTHVCFRHVTASNSSSSIKTNDSQNV